MSARDHKRCTPQGRRLGELMVRLVEPELKILAAEQEFDERCASCAFRAGTVPNGCPQTQLDALKAVAEDVPFMCHSTQERTICFGWFAARLAVERRGGVEMLAAKTRLYEFSPPDEKEAG